MTGDENKPPAKDSAAGLPQGEGGAGSKPPKPNKGPVEHDAALRDYLKGTPLKKIRATYNIAAKEVRNDLLKAFRDKKLVFQPLVNPDLSRKLEKDFDNIRHYALECNNERTFSLGAAEIFFDQFNDLLRRRADAGISPTESALNLGIVSGRTTGGMIEAVCDVDGWLQKLNIDLLPTKIHIFALNVSQTIGFEQLKGNANVLAYELSRKMRFEFSGRPIEIDANGLSAQLLQTEQNARQSDIQPETRVILETTDPTRLPPLLPSESAGGAAVESERRPTTSQLDMVITGVGSIDDSLFTKYCSEITGLLDSLKKEHVVGDIAYCPVTGNGEARKLKDSSGTIYEFYSAVRLEVLTTMSRSSHKKVILVARNKESNNKMRPIFAAIGNSKMRHCNVLITDSQTARQLEMQG